MTPRISVAICTWNGTRWLSEQLGSILRQSRPVDEIVLVDDASSDESFQLAKSILSDCQAAVQVVRNDSNIGSTRSFGKATSLCSGDWIFLSDQDDLWESRKVETFLQRMAEHPQAQWAFSDATLIDASGARIGKSLWRRQGFSKARQSSFQQSRQLETILRRPLVTGATMAVRKDALEICKPFSDEWVHDHWISLVLSGAGFPGIAIPEALTRYRIHGGQQVGDKSVGTAWQVHQSLETGADQYRREAGKLTRLARHIRSVGRDNPLVEAWILRNVRHFLVRAELRESGRIRRSLLALRELLRGNYPMSWSRLAFFKDILGK